MVASTQYARQMVGVSTRQLIVEWTAQSPTLSC
jgi:hypothetical protein